MRGGRGEGRAPHLCSDPASWPEPEGGGQPPTRPPMRRQRPIGDASLDHLRVAEVDELTSAVTCDHLRGKSVGGTQHARNCGQI